MAFWKKKNDRRKRELEGIKNRVEGKQPMPFDKQSLPPPPMEEVIEVKKEAPIIEEPLQPKSIPKISIPVNKESDETSAPLFIKIEKYESVLDELTGLKNTLQTLTRLLSFHSEVEELKADIFSRIKNTVSSITDMLISMDEIFVKPERPDITEPGKSEEDKGVEEQILDLGEELRHLKRELTKIE